MASKIIGRKEEQAILQKALRSDEAELVAVTGRRRVGKTFLITNTYQSDIVFEMIGIQNGSLAQQLQNFTDQLSQTMRSPLSLKTPNSWAEAFRMLREAILAQAYTSKKVLFFDELPWLATQKSDFLAAFGYFWNSWASRQNLVIVICGSAASWMIQQVVNDKGGLHNRITRHLRLDPFTLAETEEYLHHREAHFDRYQIVQLYMSLGGIPHYLKEIEPSKSAIQNIDTLCFSSKGALFSEFNRLYTSLFDKADTHIAIVRTLAQKRQGMTRAELIEKGKLSNGGGLTNILEELLHSGFLAEYFPFDKKKKEKIYRLCDEFSLFFLYFIEPNKQQGANIWQHLSQTATYKTWSGYAFEGICMKHIEKIKHDLGISGIFSAASSFHKKGTSEEEGLQIDLLLDRNDHNINLFEIKFYNQPYTITKEYGEQLRKRTHIFQQQTKTKKHITWIFITTFGLTLNAHASSLVLRDLTLDDLF